MSFARLLLGIIIWVGIIILEIMLMAIARFFQRTSSEHTWYRLYILPILFTVIAALRYLQRIPAQNSWPDFIGDPVANVLMSFASLFLFGLGHHLYEQMMGAQGK